MRSRLKLSLLDRAGSVERVLRVARHRGFSLREFNARQGERGLLDVSVEVESERPAMLLVSQWAKLPEVRALQIGKTMA